MSYLIIFKDRSKIQVSDETAKKLKIIMRNPEHKTFELADSLYTISGVDKIIPKAEAYDIFPMEWESLKKMEDFNASRNLQLNQNTKYLQKSI